MDVCDIVEFEDGMIKADRGYFAEPFEAPEWRAQWVNTANVTLRVVLRSSSLRVTRKSMRAGLSPKRRAPPCWSILVAPTATQNLPRVTH